MVRVGLVGGSGYGGVELLRLLAGHPEVAVVAVTSRTHVGKRLDAVLPGLRNCYELEFSDYTAEQLGHMCDVVFTATPHGVAIGLVDGVVGAGARLVDFGADFRLKSPSIYEQYYKHAPASEAVLAEAVYGLPEVNRERLATAKIVAVPGCYPTGALLAIIPVLTEGLSKPGLVVVDSKSGTSGAGSTPSQLMHFAECTENCRAYGVVGHRHTPEMEQELSLAAGREVLVSFTPHLVPMARGILTTVHLTASDGTSGEAVVEAYRRFYAGERFVRILDMDELPQTRAVMGSNFIDLTARVDARTGALILISAIDNLGKGASGQAVQCMNAMFGLDEACGLSLPGMLP